MLRPDPIKYSRTKIDSHFHVNDRYDGHDASCPYIRKNKKDKEIIIPTLVLPPPSRGRKSLTGEMAALLVVNNIFFINVSNSNF